MCLCFQHPWVITRGCVMPPRRGRRGLHPRSPWVDTHGCVMPPLRGSIFFPCKPRVLPPRRGSVFCHRDAVLCSATATRFPWVDTHGCVMPPLRGSIFFSLQTVGSAHDVRCTHGCVMSPRCGSVVCHRYAVLCSATATRLPWVNTHGCVLSPRRGSFRYSQYYTPQIE